MEYFAKYEDFYGIFFFIRNIWQYTKHFAEYTTSLYLEYLTGYGIIECLARYRIFSQDRNISTGKAHFCYIQKIRLDTENFTRYDIFCQIRNMFPNKAYIWPDIPNIEPDTKYFAGHKIYV